MIGRLLKRITTAKLVIEAAMRDTLNIENLPLRSTLWPDIPASNRIYVGGVQTARFRRKKSAIFLFRLSVRATEGFFAWRSMSERPGRKTIQESMTARPDDPD